MRKTADVQRNVPFDSKRHSTLILKVVPATETFFKLLYVGRGKPYVFGIRRDFAESIPKPKTVQWLMEFVAMPATDVLFVGFSIAVGSADVATQRLENILGTFPEPDSSLAILVEEYNDREFDLQLQNL
jgi:hypothetical protein